MPQLLPVIPDQYVEIAAHRTLPGTINALVVTYYKSDEWHALAADTQKTRRRIIERFRAQHGDKRVALLQREHILKDARGDREAIREAPVGLRPFAG